MTSDEIEIISESPLGYIMDNPTKEQIDSAKEMIAFYLTLEKEGIMSKEEARFFIGLPSKYKKARLKADNTMIVGGNIKKVSFNNKFGS